MKKKNTEIYKTINVALFWGLVLSIKYQIYIMFVVIAVEGYQYIILLLISKIRIEFYELSKNHSTNCYSFAQHN